MAQFIKPDDSFFKKSLKISLLVIPFININFLLSNYSDEMRERLNNLSECSSNLTKSLSDINERNLVHLEALTSLGRSLGDYQVLMERTLFEREKTFEKLRRDSDTARANDKDT